MDDAEGHHHRADDAVGDRQRGDKVVGHRVEVALLPDGHDGEHIAEDDDEADEGEEEGEQGVVQPKVRLEDDGHWMTS